MLLGTMLSGRTSMRFFAMRFGAGSVLCAFMAGRLIHCAAFVMLPGRLVPTFVVAHDAHKIDGADEQAHEDDYEPERGPERSLGLKLGVMIRLVMMMCTVI